MSRGETAQSYTLELTLSYSDYHGNAAAAATATICRVLPPLDGSGSGEAGSAFLAFLETYWGVLLGGAILIGFCIITACVYVALFLKLIDLCSRTGSTLRTQGTAAHVSPHPQPPFFGRNTSANPQTHPLTIPQGDENQETRQGPSGGLFGLRRCAGVGAVRPGVSGKAKIGDDPRLFPASHLHKRRDGVLWQERGTLCAGADGGCPGPYRRETTGAKDLAQDLAGQ